MKKMTFRSVFVLAAATIALSLGSLGAVLAVDSPTDSASNISLSVLPAQQRLTLEPGETKTAEITIVNSGGVEYEAKVYATPYTVSDDYTSNIFEGEELIYSQIHRWITFDGNESTDTFTLEPGERKTVEFTINVPESVPAGGQYAGIMAEIVPPPDATGVVAVRRVASLLYTNIDGETINKGEITGRTLQSFYSNQDIETSLTVKNLGNTDFAVETRLKITGLFGGEVDEIVEPTKILLPDTSRKFDLNWHSESPIGIYRLTQQVKFLDSTVEETRIIIVMPMWFILLVVIAIMVLIIVIIIRARNRREKKKRRNRHA